MKSSTKIFVLLSLIIILPLSLAFVSTKSPSSSPLQTLLMYSPRRKISAPKEPELPPLAVMLENELLSRPFQKSLSQADIVYEAPTEGGITRFMAIYFDGNYPEKMGPVRSARSYFVDFAHEYDPLYVHVGGHNDALARLRREEIRDIDQFFFDPYFRRENVGKTALEHTMFTSGEKMRALIEKEKWTVSNPAQAEQPPKSVSLKNGALDIFPPATKIDIDFGYPSYAASYEYSEGGRYFRSQAKAPHKDHLNEEQIAPSAVVVQRIKSWSNGDSQGTISMETIGQGEATIFYRGRAIPAKWEKDDLKSATRFLLNGGTEFSIRAQKTWIEILPLSNTLTYE